MKFSSKIAMLLMLLTNASALVAQDIIKIGINEEMISVPPPKLNQKVTVTIEDSTFNYQIDVMKLPKNVQVGASTIKDNPQDEAPKKIKKFDSKFFNEFEFGYSWTENKKSIDDAGYNPFSDINFQSSTFDGFFDVTGTYFRRSFIAQPSNGGMFFNLNIRDKSRAVWKSENWFYRKITQVKLSQNFYTGDMAFSQYEGFAAGKNDSLIKSDTFGARIGLTNIFLQKRLSIGYIIKADKKFSVEYGLDIGWRMFQNQNVSYKSELVVIPEDANNFYPFKSLENPYFTFYHRLGINYMNNTFNVGTSYGTRQIGTREGYVGHNLQFGFAHRFR